MGGEVTWKNVVAYAQGNLRHWCYYSDNWKWLLGKSLIEQIDWRIEIMDKECYSSGQCKMCGCKTTALQMANKSCDKPCYPKMMTGKVWKEYKLKNNI